MFDEEQDISDLELERIRIEKGRDKKLIAAIKSLVAQKDDSELKDFIEKNSSLLDLLVKKLSEISKQDAPNVTIEMNDLNNSIKSLSDNQEKIIELLNKKPTRLKVIRTQNNQLIEHIDIEY